MVAMSRLGLEFAGRAKLDIVHLLSMLDITQINRHTSHIGNNRNSECGASAK